MDHQNPTRYSSKQGPTSETPMCPSSLKIIKTIRLINSKKVFVILSLRFKFNNSAEQFHTVKLFSINILICYWDKAASYIIQRHVDRSTAGYFSFFWPDCISAGPWLSSLDTSSHVAIMQTWRLYLATKAISWIGHQCAHYMTTR